MHLWQSYNAVSGSFLHNHWQNYILENWNSGFLGENLCISLYTSNQGDFRSEHHSGLCNVGQPLLWSRSGLFGGCSLILILESQLLLYFLQLKGGHIHQAGLSTGHQVVSQSSDNGITSWHITYALKINATILRDIWWTILPYHWASFWKCQKTVMHHALSGIENLLDFVHFS